MSRGRHSPAHHVERRFVILRDARLDPQADVEAVRGASRGVHSFPDTVEVEREHVREQDVGDQHAVGNPAGEAGNLRTVGRDADRDAIADRSEAEPAAGKGDDLALEVDEPAAPQAPYHLDRLAERRHGTAAFHPELAEPLPADSEPEQCPAAAQLVEGRDRGGGDRGDGACRDR